MIVTSASWSQLRKQFFDVARLYRAHAYFRAWVFNEAEIRTPAGGFIIGISVDEAGRAEGYHSRPDSPVMILGDECVASKRGKRRLVVAAAQRLAIGLWRWGAGRALSRKTWSGAPDSKRNLGRCASRLLCKVH